MIHDHDAMPVLKLYLKTTFTLEKTQLLYRYSSFETTVVSLMLPDQDTSL